MRQKNFNPIETLIRKKRYLQAIPLLKIAVKKNSNNPDLLKRLGEIEEAARQNSEAIRVFEKFHEKFPSKPNPLRDEAFRLYHQGKTALAVKIYQELIQEYPYFLADRYRLSEIYERENRPDLATKILKRAVHEYPQADGAAYRLALLRQNQKDYSGAISLLRGLLRQNPKNAEYYNDLGVSQYLAGENADAISDFKEALQINPFMSEATLSLISIYIEEGNTRGARQICDEKTSRAKSSKKMTLLKNREKTAVFKVLAGLCRNVFQNSK